MNQSVTQDPINTIINLIEELVESN